ncbi:UNVERIFIED_CONTAM: hypothetical protein FKN15_065406 [Acipenser sinensis]
MAEVVSVGVNLEAFSLAINAIQALRSSVTRVFDTLKDGMKNKETLEGREKAFITDFQDNLQSVNRDLNELERLSNLVGRPSESHPLHNSGLLSLDPVQDKTPLYSQLLQAYKWSNKISDCSGLKKPQGSFLKGMSVGRKVNCDITNFHTAAICTTFKIANYTALPPVSPDENAAKTKRSDKLRMLQYHAGLASSLLNQQSLKRSANQMGASAKRRPKVQPTTLVLPPQ